MAGFFGVALGAFGAHSLETILDAAARSAWQTGVLYQLVHALALLAVGILARAEQLVELRVAIWAFSLGIVLFSGSIYLLTALGWSWLGPITPMGGMAFLLGWGALAVAALRR